MKKSVCTFGNDVERSLPHHHKTIESKEHFDYDDDGVHTKKVNIWEQWKWIEIECEWTIHQIVAGIVFFVSVFIAMNQAQSLKHNVKLSVMKKPHFQQKTKRINFMCLFAIKQKNKNEKTHIHSVGNVLILSSDRSIDCN